MKKKKLLKQLGEAALLMAPYFGWDDKKLRGGREAEYEDLLFDEDFVHQIDVRIDSEDWADLLKNPTLKTKYNVDLTIDSETLRKVVFSTKGASSLIISAQKQGNQRFSFKARLGKNKEGQTHHGLDKLDLNCCSFDTTLMKDYFSYRLFRLAGVPAPLAAHAWVTVNGRDHGLYLVVEKTEKSFLERNFGHGVLYKPVTGGIKMTPDKVKDLLTNGVPDDYGEDDVAHGADLVYTDDDPASYPDIFENRKTDGGKKDDAALISSLKRLSKGTKLEKGLDTHEIIRYFAVHNFLLSFDSYTGGELHNIVLCEKDGILSLVPWDYNLSFGTYITAVGKKVLKDPTNLLNLGIDTPLVGLEEKDLPIWSWIVRNEAYRKEYHETLSKLIEGYFESGAFERELNALLARLSPYEEKDPNAFYSFEEFKKGIETLRQFALRRARSVRKQLNGELAADSTKQNDSDKINASDLNLRDMGIYELQAEDDEEPDRPTA